MVSTIHAAPFNGPVVAVNLCMCVLLLHRELGHLQQCVQRLLQVQQAQSAGYTAVYVNVSGSYNGELFC